MLFPSLLLLYSLTPTLAAVNATTTGGTATEESKMRIAVGSIVALVAVLLVMFFVIRWRKKKKAYKRREAQVLDALPKLKLTRTFEEPEVHSVERVMYPTSKRSKRMPKSTQLLPSSEKHETSKEKTISVNESTSKEGVNKSNKESSVSKESPKPNKEKSTEKDNVEPPI